MPQGRISHLDLSTRLRLLKSPSYDSEVIIPWYLAGGVAAANCIAAYQPKAAASLAASYINLANPGTYNAAPGVAPTWDAVSGWIFDGSSQYLNSALPSATKPMSVLFRITLHDNTSTRIILDGWTGGNAAEIYTHAAAPKLYFSHEGLAGILQSIGVIPITDSVWAITYSSTGVAVMYLGGAFNATATVDRTFTERETRIGALYDPAPGLYYYGVITAIAKYNVVLSAPQVLAISNSMAAL